MIPSLQGAEAAITSGLGAASPAASSGGASLAAAFGSKFAAVAGPAVAAAAVVAGAHELYQLGSKFDEQFDKIRVGTGQTGAALRGLEDDFKAALSNTPAGFDEVGDAITGINQKLGLTGEPLQKMTEQFVTLARITGIDVATNVGAGTDALQSFGIQGAAQRGALDELFRASQASGVGFDQLAAAVSANGTVLRASGFDFRESTALVATLAKAGADVGEVMPGLSRGLAEAGKAGISAREYLGDLFDRIKSSPNEIDAAGIAIDVLGPKAGPKFAKLVQEGKLSYEDMLGTIAFGRDTIAKAGADTEDFSEKWQRFKNKALVAIEPVATKFFAAFGTALDKLPGWIETARGYIDGFVTWLRSVGVFDAIAKSIDWLTNTAWPGLVVGFEYVKEQVGNLVAFFSERWGKIKEAVRNVVAYLAIVWGPALILIRNVFEHMGQIVQAAWDYIRSIIAAALEVIRGVIDVVLGVLTLDFGQAWDGIKSILSGVWDAMKAVIQLALDQIRILLDIAWGTIKDLAGVAWGLIKDAVSAAIDGLVDFVKALPGRFLDALAALGGLLLDLFQKAMSGAFDAAKNIAGDMLSWYAGLPGEILSALGDVLGFLAGAGRDLLTGLYNGAKEASSLVLDFMYGLPVAITGALGDMSQWLWDAGVSLLHGLWEGIKSAKDWLFGKISDLAGGIKSAITNPLGIFSPSRVMMEVGGNIAEGLAIGLAKGEPMVLRAADAISVAATVQPSIPAGSVSGSTSGSTSGPTLLDSARALIAAAEALTKAAAAEAGTLQRSEIQRLARMA